MKQQRISPGLFKKANYLYAFCGEIYSVERYKIEQNKWEKLDVIFPEQFYARYGIKCIPLQNEESGKVLIFGGDQLEVRLYDTNSNVVDFIKKKKGAIKGLFSKDSNIKLECNGIFYN